MLHEEDIKMPIIKAVSAWLLAVITSLWQTFSTIPWDKLAQFAAFVYSICLIYEYVRKKVIPEQEEKLDGSD